MRMVKSIWRTPINQAVRVYNLAHGDLSTMTKGGIVRAGDVMIVKGQLFVADTNHNSIKNNPIGWA